MVKALLKAGALSVASIVTAGVGFTGLASAASISTTGPGSTSIIYGARGDSSIYLTGPGSTNIIAGGGHGYSVNYAVYTPKHNNYVNKSSYNKNQHEDKNKDRNCWTKDQTKWNDDWWKVNCRCSVSTASWGHKKDDNKNKQVYSNNWVGNYGSNHVASIYLTGPSSYNAIYGGSGAHYNNYSNDKNKSYSNNKYEDKNWSSNNYHKDNQKDDWNRNWDKDNNGGNWWGGGSTSTTRVSNDNDVNVNNRTTQNAQTGNATVSHNTVGGNATSGDATNNASTFTDVSLHNDNSGVNSSWGGSGNKWGGNRSSKTVDNDNSVRVSNNTSQYAKSGNATVSYNTFGGNATSGDASNSSHTETVVEVNNN